MISYQLTRPISYLLIKDKSKWKIDWLIPLIISLLLTVGYSLLPVDRAFYGEKGIIKELQGFLQILPGFYLAALAAIATFNKNDLDYHLPAPTPQIEVTINSHEITISLTRRRMLSYLFGYLTFLSLVLYLVTVLGSILAPSARIILESYFYETKIGIFFILNLFFNQMIIVTVFGLYQLCERIHQPDQN